MLGHQPGQCRAIALPVPGPQRIRRLARQAELARDPGRHPDLDLVEKPRLRRIKRVVQVKDPDTDMGKGDGRHARALSPAAAMRKRGA
jgi:hypothetical protein